MPRQTAAALIATALLLAGCGGDETTRERTGAAGGQTTTPERRPAPATRSGEEVEPARCPGGVPECRSATGRVVYVERVDPDGDGDAHFVILDPQGITLPRLTAIDLRAGLRPSPLPGPGDLVSAAGPVQTGSYGQSQIHALEFNVAGR